MTDRIIVTCACGRYTVVDYVMSSLAECDCGRTHATLPEARNRNGCDTPTEAEL